MHIILRKKKKMKFKTNLEHRIAIINAIGNNESKEVYRCIKCDNLSLDPINEGWVIFLEKPQEPKGFTYIFDVCDYCKIGTYSPVRR